MKQLTPLPKTPGFPEYVDRYIEIRDRKYNPTRSRLTKNHDFVEWRFLELEDAYALHCLGDLMLMESSSTISNAFLSCYESETIALNTLRKAIKGAQPPRLLKYCPMCGTTLTSTFDHYLPQSLFPEFSVHPLNLVPCCSLCNETKGDEWLNLQGERQFFHAYSADSPTSQYLLVALTQLPGFDTVGATFSIARPQGIADKAWRLLESHYRRLDLIGRYDRLGNDEIADLLASCRSHLDSGGANPSGFLLSQAAKQTAIYGGNHWRVVLMQALAQHPTLNALVNAA